MMSRFPWNSSSAGTDRLRPRSRSRSGWHWRPLLAGLLVLACPLAAAADPQADWARYRQAFVQDDGRVVDTGNGKVSHTESQGWGLLFAVNAGDREAFDRMWGWTSATLLRKDAALFSWK